MEPFVVYSTKTGNTKKVARVIAKELGVKAQGAKEVKSVPKGAPLIAGSGVYASRISGEMKDFLEDLPKVSKGKAAVFETSGGYNDGKNVGIQQLERSLKQKGYRIVGRFGCSGQMFRIFNRGHPSPEELEKAMKFAAGLKKSF
ncbi:MAG: hypothetical protein JSV63_02115 [Candidatus Aenigmatarchaeota archaeon]|nr:MAG: hypothetical protein JSV63_02115 [Candidatus Aenigmarchaeota archaeon]